ncbi:MAG: nicotinate phosphoribosyltransferase [bacterium]|nr:nicotinate phosphoribosyltransferase [bacterium]
MTAAGASAALMTDQYELTMIDAALRSGTADLPATFEVFCRRLPPGRRYGVVAGTARLLAALEDFRFGPAESDFLRRERIVSDAALGRLAEFSFSGDIAGYREGEFYVPGSPILTVSGTFAETVVLETLVLSILNHDSAIAAAAARMRAAAGARTLLEGGSRRTHEEAAPAAARAAYVCGFDATSNLEAGRRFGVPTGGTIGHAFILAHADERAAMAAQFDLLGAGSTYLVDTYDVAEGVRRAVAAAGPDMGALRIDSGDLGASAVAVRRQLDELGAHRTRIILSGDLDEHDIAALAPAPADGYLVGTELVAGAGAPTAGLVYKLVEIDGRPVRKRSLAKSWRPGRKRAFRLLDDDGLAAAEVLLPPGAAAPAGGVGLQTEFVRGGALTSAEFAAAVPAVRRARAYHREAATRLRPAALDLAPGEPWLPVESALEDA